MEIYIHRNNEDFGPYSREVVLEYISQGVFKAQDYAAFVGMSEWKTLGKILGIPDPSRPAPAADFAGTDFAGLQPPPVSSPRERAVRFILRASQATRHLLPSPAALPGPAALIRRFFIAVSVVLFFAVGIYIHRAGRGSSAIPSPVAVPPAVASSQSAAPAAAPAHQPAPAEVAATAPAAPGPSVAPAKSLMPGMEVTPVTADTAPAAPGTPPAPAASAKAPLSGMEVSPVAADTAPAPAAPPAAPAVQSVAAATPPAAPAAQPPAAAVQPGPAVAQAVTPAAQPTASAIPATPVVTPPPPRPFNPVELAPFPAAWPRTVLLTQPVNFPAVFNGQIVGSLTVPARTPVRLANIQGTFLVLDFQGGAQRVPWQMTNLADEMTKSGWIAPAPAGPATTAANTAAPSGN